jgi:hypothetical protein
MPNEPISVRPQDMPSDVHEPQTNYSAPLKVVRQHCLSCCNGSFVEVNLCSAKSCPLWPFRHGRRPTGEDKSAVLNRQLHPRERDLTGNEFHGTGLRAIRLRCLDCSGNSDGAVRSCGFGPSHRDGCALHPYRLGRNPNIKRSEGWKAAAAERLWLARAARRGKLYRDPQLSGEIQSPRGNVPGQTPPENSERPIGFGEHDEAAARRRHA